MKIELKKRDIIVLIIAGVAIIGSIMGIYYYLSPKKTDTSHNSEADKINQVPNTFDENTYKEVESLSDYGKPTLDNIGKNDLFGSN